MAGTSRPEQGNGRNHQIEAWLLRGSQPVNSVTSALQNRRTQKKMVMKAIEITQTGGPEVMQMSDLAIPEPQYGEVLIQIAASGINFVDLFVREGRFGNQAPFTPGHEGAGIVVAIGPDVSDFKQGDRVAWCS